jgi:hypothetical protein
MSYTDHTLFFPAGRLVASFIATFQSRYTDPATGWDAVHWDDDKHTRRRKASIADGTIVPTPVYSEAIPEDPAEFTDAWRAAHLTGHTITLGWPDAFLADLARSPQPEPELFDGIVLQS